LDIPLQVLATEEDRQYRYNTILWRVRVIAVLKARSSLAILL